MDQGWGDVPEPPGGYGTAVVDWLAGEERPTGQALALLILELARQGALRLAWEGPGLHVERVRAARLDHEAQVMDLLFDRAGRGCERIPAAAVAEWIATRPEEARRWHVLWADAVTQHALAELRGTPRGALRRRQTRRDRDQLREQWQSWAGTLATSACIRDRHPDQLGAWSRALALCVPLGQAVAVAARLEGALSASERAELAGGWYPDPGGAGLGQALEATLGALPRLDDEPPQ